MRMNWVMLERLGFPERIGNSSDGLSVAVTKPRESITGACNSGSGLAAGSNAATAGGIAGAAGEGRGFF